MNNLSNSWRSCFSLHPYKVIVWHLTQTNHNENDEDLPITIIIIILLRGAFKLVFGKRWEFGPKRGVTESQVFKNGQKRGEIGQNKGGCLNPKSQVCFEIDQNAQTLDKFAIRSGGSSRLVQIPNFGKKSSLKAPLRHTNFLDFHQTHATVSKQSPRSTAILIAVLQYNCN